MHYEADVFPGGLTVRSRDPDKDVAMRDDTATNPGGLTVRSRDPDPMTTTYGMLADLIGLAHAPTRQACRNKPDHAPR